jgi:DNA-directed RNA polymerase subunit M
MMFCDCGGMFMPYESGSKCRSCGKIAGGKNDLKVITSSSKKETIVIEDNKPDLPVTDNTCDECGNAEAYYWMIQTRSSDEPPTQFFRCTKCKHTWREYK